MLQPESSTNSVKLRTISHVPVLDHLRGIAAFAVCIFHFTNGNPNFLPNDDWLRQLGSFGWLGVEAFFVISGFVIPYSLYFRDYQLRTAGGFLLRRIKRLEPPYLACIAVVLSLQFLSSITPGFKGQSFSLDLTQLLAHLGYLNAIFNYQWFNPVFWTLAIEFQFYLFIAIFFPLLKCESGATRWISLLAIASMGWLGGGNIALLPHWLPLFAIGMATFQGYVGLNSIRQTLCFLAFLGIIGCVVVGCPHTLAGMIAACSILLFRDRKIPWALAPFALLGPISYSLYLLHVPIGGRIINLAGRLPDSSMYRYLAIIIALLFSIICAATFWFVIERPSQRLAKNSKVGESSAKSRRVVHPTNAEQQ